MTTPAEELEDLRWLISELRTSPKEWLPSIDIAHAILAAGWRRDEGWIATSERMPDPGIVMTYRPGFTDPQDGSTYRDCINASYFDGERSWCDGYHGMSPVTHWRPIPPPPSLHAMADKGGGG